MNTDPSRSQPFKPPVTTPNTSPDQAELNRRIRATQSPSGPPPPPHAYNRGRQQKYAERAPESH